MYFPSVLELISPQVIMSSNPDPFLIKGDALPGENIVTAEVQDKRAPEELEDGYQKVEEEHGEDDGGRCNCSNKEVQEKGLSEDICCGRRLLRGNICCVGSEDDGFRTPVSVNHRIASAAECPPAPKKQKPVPWRKRKLPPSDGKDDNRISLIIHLSDEEVEAMFLPIVPPEAHNKIKKARREDSHE